MLLENFQTSFPSKSQSRRGTIDFLNPAPPKVPLRPTSPRRLLSALPDRCSGRRRHAPPDAPLPPCRSFPRSCPPTRLPCAALPWSPATTWPRGRGEPGERTRAPIWTDRLGSELHDGPSESGNAVPSIHWGTLQGWYAGPMVLVGRASATHGDWDASAVPYNESR